jgi:hypothetical protein
LRIAQHELESMIVGTAGHVEHGKIAQEEVDAGNG